MKYLSISLVFGILTLGFSITAIACDDSSASLVSAVNNGDGTYTYVIEVCPEYNGLEGNPDMLTFEFGGVPISTSPMYAFSPASYSTSSGDVYTGTLVSGNTVLEYSTPSIFIAHSGTTLCTTFTITTIGFSTEVEIETNDYPSALCTIELDLPDFGGGCVGTPAFVGN